jgi:hypothetical protein
LNLQFITTADGVQRVLGLVPSQVECPVLMSGVPVSSDQIIPQSELLPYEQWPRVLPVLNQGSWNACTYYASTQALMYGRYQNGQAYVPLDPMWPYMLVTRGANVGTNLLDASQRIAEYGVPPVDTPKGKNVEEAQRFRFEFSQQFLSWPQILSSVARRRAVVGSVCVGESWNQLDAEGVPGVTRGVANHAIFLGGGLKFSAEHGWMIKHCGSWGQAWGQDGFAWFTEAHWDSSSWAEAYGVQGVTEDLAIDVPPPVSMA